MEGRIGKLLRIEKSWSIGEISRSLPNPMLRSRVAFWVFYPLFCTETIYIYLNHALLAKEDLENDQHSMYLALSIKMC